MSGAARSHNEGSELLARTSERQDQHGHRHGTSPVHADLRAALEGLTGWCSVASRRPSCLRAASTPCARRWRHALIKKLAGNAVYVGSAGVRKGELDPFAVAVMEEAGQDIAKHRPDDVRGTRRLGGPQLRSDHHAVAGSPSQGDRTDAQGGGRC